MNDKTKILESGSDSKSGLSLTFILDVIGLILHIPSLSLL